MVRIARAIKEFFINLLDGYAWASTSRRKVMLGIGIFGLAVWLIAWHTDQFVCDLGNLRSTYGIPYWIIFIVAILLLLHEADYKWENEWIKLPVGLLSVYFIHYGSLSLLWIAFASITWMPPWISNYASVLILVFSGIFTVVGFHNANKLKVTTYSLKIGKLRNPGKIVMVSDLHLGSFVRAKHVKRIVKKINALEPDWVIVAGDLIDDDHALLENQRQQEKAAAYFRRIQCKNKILLTLGNHDPNVEDTRFCAFLEMCSIQLLHNDIMDTPDYSIIGRSDPTNNQRSELKALFQQCSTEKPTIVVDHDPQYMSEAVDAGAALVLSGHTHAGQFFPASIFTKWAVGKNRFYGYHMENSTHTVISSGAGCFNLPVRLGSSNEIVELQLEAV